MFRQNIWMITGLVLLCFHGLAGHPFIHEDSLGVEKITPDKVLSSDSIKADQEPAWKLRAKGGLSLNQISFTNWAEGGQSTIAANGHGSFKAGYQKKDFKMDNFLNLAYGMSWNEEQGSRKSDDKMDAGTSIGYKAFDHWFYSFVAGMKTQFSPGFKYPNDSVMVSRFFAPATLLISMGMEYKPDEHTSIFISPSSGKFIFVNDQELANKGAFGVDPAIIDTSGSIIRPGANYRSDFGINLIINLERDLFEHVNMDSKLNLHNNYMDRQLSNRWNFDVDWETAFNFKINSFLSSLLYIHLLYDDDVPIPTYEQVEGQKIQTGESPKLQIKQNFGVGLTFSI